MLPPHLNQPPSTMRMAFFVPLLFSGLVACQEETGPGNSPAVDPATIPNTSQGVSSPSMESNMPNPSEGSSTSSDQPRMLTGEVVSLNGKIYVIKDSVNKEIRVEANSMTLVDEGIEVGDKAEIRYSVDDKPTAIRKVR